MVSVEIRSLLSRLNRFCARTLEAAAGVCVSRGHYEVTVEHVLALLLEDASADLNWILKHFEVDWARARKALNNITEKFRTGSAGRPVFSPLLIDWIQEAWVLASLDHNLAEIRSGILLRALLSNPMRFTSEDYTELFQGIRRDELKTNYAVIVSKSSEGAATFAKGAEEKGGAGGAPGGGDSALKKYGNDYTGRAREGKIDPVFGRDREIRQMIDILGRRRKNNPIIVGEAGVGKTALVEGLAVKIVEGKVPEQLKNVHVLTLDLGALQAGAGVKGEFENRLKG